MNFFVNTLLPILVGLFVLTDGIVLAKNKKKMVSPFILGWIIYMLFDRLMLAFADPSAALRILVVQKKKEEIIAKGTQATSEEKATLSLIEFIQQKVFLWLVAGGEIIGGGMLLLGMGLYGLSQLWK